MSNKIRFSNFLVKIYGKTLVIVCIIILTFVSYQYLGNVFYFVLITIGSLYIIFKDYLYYILILKRKCDLKIISEVAKFQTFIDTLNSHNIPADKIIVSKFKKSKERVLAAFTINFGQNQKMVISEDLLSSFEKKESEFVIFFMSLLILKISIILLFYY